jgi:hypothetical protein
MFRLGKEEAEAPFLGAFQNQRALRGRSSRMASSQIRNGEIRIEAIQPARMVVTIG